MRQRSEIDNVSERGEHDLDPGMDFAGFEAAEWLPEGEIADDVEGDEI